MKLHVCRKKARTKDKLWLQIIHSIVGMLKFVGLDI